MPKKEEQMIPDAEPQEILGGKEQKKDRRKKGLLQERKKGCYPKVDVVMKMEPDKAAKEGDQIYLDSLLKAKDKLTYR